MAAFTEKMTKEIYPYHTTLYENLFLLRVSISLNETAATIERQAGQKLFRWRSLCSDPDITMAVESCASKLQECLHEHGGGEVGQIWLDGDVPVFHVNFHTKLALSKLLAGQCEVEKKLMTKLQRGWGSPGGVRCDTELYLVCPDYTTKNDHKVIEVNSTNQETCMEMWVESQLFEVGSLLRGHRMEVPRPDVSLKLLSNDLTFVWRWYPLGIQFGVPDADLRKIECDYQRTDDRMLHMISEWLRIDEQPSWLKVVRALVAINERHVARNIAEKYGIPFPSELEQYTTQTQRKATATFPVIKTESDVELRTKIKRIKPSIEKEDFKLVKIDKELDELKMERRQNRKRTASAREEAEVVVEDVERLEQEKELLLEEIMKKESELDCFKKLLSQHLSISQREKEVLQESIKLKENELREARAKLEEKEKQLEKYKEKIQRLKKRIEEGVRELGVRDGRITELEKDKARAVAALESERMKSVERVEILRGELRKEHAEKEDQLRERLTEKDAYINSHLKDISDLQQQLKLAVEMNAQSLAQYKQLATLQEARMEREREKIAIESELMVVTRKREEYMKAIKELTRAEEAARREQRQFSDTDEPPPLPPRTYSIKSTPQVAGAVALPHSIKQRKLTVQCYKKKRAPRKMIRGSAVADDQFAYFTLADTNSVYKYQWRTEKWDVLPPSPYYNSGLVIIDGELTAVGGEILSCTNELFTLRPGQWVEHYPPMNTKRSSPAIVSTSDGNSILVIGGYVGGGHGTAKVELFHLRSRKWYKLTNLPEAFIQPSATICGNQLYVIGYEGDGYSCSLQALLSADQSIMSQSISNILTWTLLPQQPAKRSTAATLCEQLVIVGGEQDWLPVNYIHQLIDGQWVKIGSLIPGGMRCLVLVVSPSPDKIVIVGGNGENSVEEFVVV